MKLGVDLDNTVLVFQPFWAELYNEWFDKNLNLEKLTEWDDLKEKTHFESHAEFFEWFARADGWRKMPFERGAPGGLDALVAAGHQLTFITARNGEAVVPTQEWFAMSPWYSKKHHLVTARDDKWSIPCSIYIDDSPRVINGLIDAGKPVIIMDKPWNKTIPKPPPCGECNGSGTLEYPSGEVNPLDMVTTKPCPFCEGTGGATKVYRATSWRQVVEIVERFERV